jgi:2-iminobutanoate/2-iminopropanoate deaminase
VTVTYRNAESLPPPLGLYSHIARVGDFAFFSGMAALGWDGEVVGKGDLERQIRTIYAEMGEVLREEGLVYSNIVQMTTYLAREEDIAEFYRVRAIVFEEVYPDRKYPPNATLVCKPADPELLIEVQFVAAA